MPRGVYVHETGIKRPGKPGSLRYEQARRRAEMKALHIDDYAAWMLENGYYDVVLETGIVSNARTGRALKAIPRKDGYCYVTLAFGRLERPIYVHRLVAIKALGLEVVRGKEIAHVDTVKDHNWASNLAAVTEKQHFDLDGGRPLVHEGGKPKASWPPCARCGDPDGQIIGKNSRTPYRVSGRRFGIDGSLCRKCYHLLETRERRGSAANA